MRRNTIYFAISSVFKYVFIRFLLFIRYALPIVFNVCAFKRINEILENSLLII